jgi:uncharacterized protein YbjT (DUF2867 family)
MVLLIGATGKIGRTVAKNLAQADVPTRALVRDPAKAADLAAAGVELVQGAAGDRRALDAALAGVDRVYLALGGMQDQEVLEKGVIDAAAAAGVRHIVKISVVGAAPDAIVTLARWHHSIEQHLAASGVPATVVRPNFFMQNYLASAGTIAGEGKIYGNSGTGATSLIDDRDIADVAVAALTQDGHAGQTYTLTGAVALTQDEVAAQIGAAIGRPVEYVNLADDQFKGALLGMGLPEWLVDDYVALGVVQQNGWAAAVTDDVNRILGREPRTFAQFATDFAGTFSGTA